MKEIPIWEKSNLSLEEAAAYSGIKRRLFDQFIEQAYSI